MFVAAALAMLAAARPAAGDEPGTLSIRSEPAGAFVDIDGVTVGTTPYQGKLGPGLHLVTVRMPGYETFQLDFVMPAGRDLELPIPALKSVGGVPPAPRAPAPAAPASGAEPEPPAPAPPPAPPRAVPAVTGKPVGLLHVTTRPGGASIWVDGKAAGAAPYSGEVAPGMHAIVARLAGYRVAEADAVVRPGEETARVLELSPEPVPLRVETEPPGASVFVDDKELGTTPYFATLIAGTHWVKVKLTGFKPVEKKVDAAAAVPVELRFELQKGVANLKKTTRFSTYNYIGSITVNPLMLVGGLIHAQYEHAMGESFGAVGGLAIQLPFAASQGGGLWVHGGVNYYFGHVGGEEFDGFHAGARLLLGVSSQFGAGVGFGLLGGYKFIFGPGITISAGLGFDVIGTTRGPVPLPIVEADAGWSF